MMIESKTSYWKFVMVNIKTSVYFITVPREGNANQRERSTSRPHPKMTKRVGQFAFLISYCHHISTSSGHPSGLTLIPFGRDGQE